MTGKDDDTKKPAKTAKAGNRDARLAAALRENLRRRKAQERARSAEERGREGSAGPDGGSRAGKASLDDENR